MVLLFHNTSLHSEVQTAVYCIWRWLLLLCCRCANAASFLNGIAGTVTFGGPALFSSVWFPANQRTTATAIISMFNYLGGSASMIIGKWKALFNSECYQIPVGVWTLCPGEGTPILGMVERCHNDEPCFREFLSPHNLIDSIFLQKKSVCLYDI